MKNEKIALQERKEQIYQDLLRFKKKIRESGKLSDKDRESFDQLNLDYSIASKELDMLQDEDTGGKVYESERKGTYTRDNNGAKHRIYSRGEKIGKPVPILSPEEYIRIHLLGGQGIENEIQERVTSTTSGQPLAIEFSDQVIDLVRAQSAVFRAGAKTMKISGDAKKFTKITTDGTATFTSENGEISASDPGLTTLEIDSETLLMLNVISRQAYDDSVNAASAMLAQAVGAFATKLDNAALEGSGTPPVPEGVFFYTSVNSVNMSAGDQVGKWSATGFTPILNAQKSLGDYNEFNITGMIMSPRSFRDLSDAVDTTGQPLQMPSAIASIPIYRTGSGVISDARQLAASGSECSTVYLANWERLFYVSRIEFNTQVLRERYAEYYQLGLLFSLRGSFYPTHETSFAKIVGVLDESSTST